MAGKLQLHEAMKRPKLLPGDRIVVSAAQLMLGGPARVRALAEAMESMAKKHGVELHAKFGADGGAEIIVT